MNPSSRKLPHLSGQYSQGTFLLEFALVSPLIFFLVVAALTYNEFIQLDQKMELITRQAAVSAFHRCIGPWRAAGILPGERVEPCLQIVSNNTFEHGRELFSDVKVILSYFELDRSGRIVRRTRVKTVHRDSRVLDRPTSGGMESAEVEERFRSVIEATGGIVITEIFAPDDRLLSHFLNSLPADGVQYGVAIS